MSRIVSINFILVGPNEGKTGEWGNKKFIEGLHPFYGTDAQFEITKRFLKDYGAYPLDTDEHSHALACYAAVLAGQEMPEAPLPVPLAGEDPGTEPKPEIFENQRLILAILSLDPEDNRMWTKDETPLLGWVERHAEFGGINRRMVNEAIPGWTRTKAREYKARLTAEAAPEQQKAAEPEKAADPAADKPADPEKTDETEKPKEGENS